MNSFAFFEYCPMYLNKTPILPTCVLWENSNDGDGALWLLVATIWFTSGLSRAQEQQPYCPKGICFEAILFEGLSLPNIFDYIIRWFFQPNTEMKVAVFAIC